MKLDQDLDRGWAIDAGDAGSGRVKEDLITPPFAISTQKGLAPIVEDTEANIMELSSHEVGRAVKRFSDGATLAAIQLPDQLRNLRGKLPSFLPLGVREGSTESRNGIHTSILTAESAIRFQEMAVVRSGRLQVRLLSIAR